jgi:DNA-binding MarR family transcriptional regulator
MSKKLEFINYVQDLMRSVEEPIEMSDEASAFWEALKAEEFSKEEFTENGKMLLKYFQELSSDIGGRTARQIAEDLFINSRTVSGAARKLISDGYLEKLGKDPILYSITEKGKSKQI